ncbi:hypothetical protein HXX76_013412 [Chlamydomonas incerta]|uniref:AFG1-like ATPase n=1 Tax=Chlamydomonas incerta TaxID=51695 RepID=A0A835VQT3_CHLIN|nr:hypothetical protein HXX76_013412 [Chlamydomonas incerta]|eukprot:KAG2425787.1 hypothetical protein HXX76_013412 [Chlamydomonas incerta]
MLQELYDDLQKAGAGHALAHQPNRHKPRRRPSGLTIVDHVGEDAKPSAASTSGNSWFSSLFNSGNGNGSAHVNGKGAHSLSLGRDAPGKSAADAPPAVRGLYMYGGVGCGKTMLMDVFVHTAPAHFRVLRTHFHDFMLEVHGALRKHSREADPLLAVADGIAARCRVLALDELFVTDVADAMILNRLFGRLWERGVVLVATSNRPPDDLYKGGLQRNLFMPFIHRLKNQCRAHDMASGTDYRRLAQHQRGLYFVQPTPAGAVASGATDAIPCAETAAVVSAEEELASRFKELTGGAPSGPGRIEVAMGRHLDVPLAAGKACMFSFGELCGRPVAAADYLALTGAYHTLALQGVPVFGAANRSEAYRFVTLIDVLYEARTRLLVTAAAAPVDLFRNIITQFDAAKDPELASRPDVVVDDNLGFAKDRTISRLTEMQSLQYMLHHARQHEPSLVLAMEEAFSKKVKAAKFAGH